MVTTEVETPHMGRTAPRLEPPPAVALARLCRGRPCDTPIMRESGAPRRRQARSWGILKRHATDDVVMPAREGRHGAVRALIRLHQGRRRQPGGPAHGHG